MNADDMKRLLERSLHEGGMNGAPGPDETSIAGRVRGARRRRAAGSAVAGVASIALIAAVVWQVGGFTNDPNPPATPTTTATDTPTDEPTDEPTDTPTGDPTDEPTGGDGTDPGDWSDAVFPECGDIFSGLPERTSQLVVTQGPTQTLGAGGGQWLTQVENTGSTTIQGPVAYDQTVVVDGDGVVVATISPADNVFWGAEGGSYLSIAGGEALPFRVTESARCGTDDHELLGSGEYEMYLLLTIGQGDLDDPEQLEQAQGGPFPLVIDESVETPPVELPVPEGAVPWTFECGGPWTAPAVDTGFELEVVGQQIRSPRSASDDIDGASRLTVTQQVAGTLYNDVVVIQDGQVMTHPFAGDSGSEHFLSADSQVDLSFGSGLQGCDGSTLPPGEYQVVVLTVLHQWSAGADDGSVTSIVAATEPVDLVLN